MYNPIGVPIACGFLGSVMGLVAGCGQCFPVIVGSATGASVGCVICIYSACFPSSIPVAKIADSQPTVIQNVYIISSTGAPKFIGTNTESDVPSK
jgi:hypothetical protein